MNRFHSRTAAQALLTFGGLLLAACGSGSAPSVSQAASTSPVATLLGQPPQLGSPALPRQSNLNPLPNLQGERGPVKLQTLSLTPLTNVVALKVLVLSAGANDFGVAAATAMLAQAGVPYDVLDASVAGSFTASTLVAPDGSGKYQGVMLTSGGLSYEASPGVWASALDWTAWNLLWQYERDYHVRQLSLYTYPSTWPEDYGLRDAGAASGSADLHLAAGASAIMTDLRPGGSVPVRYAYNYPATLSAVAGVSTTPLLLDSAGRVLAAQSTTDGRERLALTFAQNPSLLHTELLGYSLVNWLTQGVYLGEYRRYNQLDIDDWFLPGDVFDPATNGIKPDAFRLSASDALALPNQLNALRNTYPVSANFRFSLMFNGGGANIKAPNSCNPWVGGPDPLSSASRCLAPFFDWVSHTKDHEYMDFLNYADSYAQLQPNLTIGASLGLPVSAHSLVSGDMSGLGYYNPAGDGPKTNYGLGASNTNFLSAAVASGTQFLASNLSVPGQSDSACTNCGLVHPLNADIFLVPRWPTNVFYSVTTPTQATAAYNSVYAPGGSLPFWDHALSYTEFLDKESDVALGHLLAGGAYPHYMHQNNLRQYATGRSLAYDWEAAVLSKYSAYSTLPLKTLRWDDLGSYMRQRTAYMHSGTSGTWDRSAGTLTVVSANGGPAFITGSSANLSDVYAAKPISTLTLAAGQSVTIPAH